MRFIAITFLVAATAISPAAAQDAGATRGSDSAATGSLADLKPAQVRRLDHYANKLLEEIAALVKAQGDKDQDAEKLHMEQITDLAGRYMKGADAAGLDHKTADAYFQSTLAQNYTGRLPRVLISDSGLPSIDGLLSGTNARTSNAKGMNEDNFIDYLRSEGTKSFD